MSGQATRKKASASGGARRRATRAKTSLGRVTRASAQRKVQRAAPAPLDLVGDYLLLATGDRTGRGLGSYHAIGFGGAILAQFALEGAIRLDGQRVLPLDRAPSDAWLVGLWRQMHGRKVRSAKDWVYRFSREKHVRRAIVMRHVQAGRLREERAWWGGRRYPTADAAHEQRLRNDVLRAVERRAPGDGPRLCLAAVLVAAKADHELLADRGARRHLRAQLKSLRRGDAVAHAVGGAVDDIIMTLLLIWMAAGSGNRGY